MNVPEDVPCEYFRVTVLSGSFHLNLFLPIESDRSIIIFDLRLNPLTFIFLNGLLMKSCTKRENAIPFAKLVPNFKSGARKM
jgi:hypothetical protein